MHCQLFGFKPWIPNLDNIYYCQCFKTPLPAALTKSVSAPWVPTSARSYPNSSLCLSLLICKVGKWEQLPYKIRMGMEWLNSWEVVKIYRKCLINVGYYYYNYLYCSPPDSGPALPTLQNPSLQSRLILSVPSSSVLSSLLLPWVCIAGWVPGGFEAMLCPTPTEQRTSVPMPPPPSNSRPLNTGGALGMEAMNTCEDDALCEMVEMTWLMRESNCSKQRNQQWGPRIYGPDLSPAQNQSLLENWVVIITKSQNDRFSHEASKAP